MGTRRILRVPGPVFDWPNASNTGVPAGTSLTAYTGPGGFNGSMTATIDSKIINDDIRLYDSASVTITRSVINGHVDIDSASASLVMTDVEVDAGTWRNAAVGFQNMTLTRCNIHGGITAVNASINVLVDFCYLHSQYLEPESEDHLGGFLCSGGHDISVTDTWIECKTPDNGFGGGPSGTCQLFGDFAVCEAIEFDHVYFASTPGAYTASFGWNPGGKPFGDNPAGIVVRNSVFERGANGKGGSIGTVTSFKASEPTNVWENNTWHDTGLPIPSDI